MEPIAIENRPNFYKRPTLIARKPRESIAAKDYSIVDKGSGTNGGGSSGTNDGGSSGTNDGIYLQYRFEENGNEEKNGSYNLTPNGSPNFSNYVELDGDDYLSVGINFEVKTLSFWFNLNNANTDNYLLSFDSDFYIKVNSNSLDVQTDNENNCNISKDFFNNIWYNLALTSNNENYDIYLNNIKLPETIIYKDLSSSTLNIGAYITDIKYLNGKIADLRLYNTIKTEDEINTIYNQYNYVNIYTHIPEEDIDYDFSSIATFQGWKAKADSHNIQYFNFLKGIDDVYFDLLENNNEPNNFMFIQGTSVIYKEYIGLLLKLPTTHNYVEFTITSRSGSYIDYTMFIDTFEKLNQDIFISNEAKNYKFEDNIEKFNEEYYYFAQFSSASSSVTKKYNYKPGHYLKITNTYSYDDRNFDPNIKITLKKNYTEYTNLTFNENALFDILVVGGGGAGGNNNGGGGGGGAVIHCQNKTIPIGNYIIKVGRGGNINQDNGEPSEAFLAIADGGGGGGKSMSVAGKNGGCGGGAPWNSGSSGDSVITDNSSTALFSSWGGTHNVYGGDGNNGSYYAGGGGGGAGGADTSSNTNGNDGIQIDIDGNNYYWAGGGGGYSETELEQYFGGNGGLGGGGGGGHYNNPKINDGIGGTGGMNNGGDGGEGTDITSTFGGDGGAHTGSGGGAGYLGLFGKGGSGIVILKKIRTDPPAPDGILTLNIVNDFDSGYILDSSISSNYANITKIILNVNANIYRNDKLENYGQAGLIIDLNSLTKLTELELNINPSKGIYGGPGSPGTSGNPGGGLGGDPIKIIGNGSISIRYTEGAKLFKGGNGGNYTDWNDEVTIELGYALGAPTYQPKPIITIPNTDGLIGEFFNGNKKVKYNYNIIFEDTHEIKTTLDILNGNDYEVIDTNTGRNIFNNDNVYRYVCDSDRRTIDIHFVNKPAEGTDMTPFVMDILSATPIVFNNNHPIIYDFSHITSLADWNTYATDYGFNSTFDAGFQEANYLYYTGVWTHHPATGFISKEIPAGYNKLRVEYQALWEDSTPDIADTVSIYITTNDITTGTNDITEIARDTVTVAEGLKIFEATINHDTDKYLTVAERYSTLSNNLKIVFY